MAIDQFSDLNGDEMRELLTLLLLRAPRRPGGPLWSAAVEILPQIEELGDESPIFGIASSDGKGERPELFLLAREESIDPGHIQERLSWDLPFETLISRGIRPAARPAKGGDSISGEGVGGDTGTLGCLVRDPAGDLFILGCNHTLAGVNRSVVNQDTVLQPGAHDGGVAGNDTLGKLAKYETIMLGGYHQNHVDAAIAEPAEVGDVEAGVRDIGDIQGVGISLAHRARVQKMGWQTKRTFGEARYGVSYEVNFAGVGDALFVGQHGIVGDDDAVGFAARGDSGAAVLTEDSDELAAMIIGVDEDLNMAIASPIGPVLSALGVIPVT